MAGVDEHQLGPIPLRHLLQHFRNLAPVYLVHGSDLVELLETEHTLLDLLHFVELDQAVADDVQYLDLLVLEQELQLLHAGDKALNRYLASRSLPQRLVQPVDLLPELHRLCRVAHFLVVYTLHEWLAE